MTELRDAFQQLLAEHSRIGSPVPDYLLPGRSVAEVRKTLADLGLDPASDVVEYFTLQDGIDNDRWLAGGSDRHELWLYPFYRSPALDEAVLRYRMCREVSVDLFGPEPRMLAELPECGYWARAWFPVFLGEYSFAVDCRGGEGSLVWGQDSHPGDPTGPLFDGLAQLLSEARERFELGILQWRADWLAFDSEDALSMVRNAQILARAARWAADLDPLARY